MDQDLIKYWMGLSALQGVYSVGIAFSHQNAELGLTQPLNSASIFRMHLRWVFKIKKERLGEEEELAKRSFKQVIYIDPGSPVTHYPLAQGEKMRHLHSPLSLPAFNHQRC